MRRLLLIATMLAAFLAIHPAGAIHAQGNSDAAHACQGTGYTTLYRGDGSTFKNAGDCTSYAAKGGQFATPLPTCTVDPTADNGAGTGCITLDNVALPSGSATLTLSGEVSFSPTETSCWPSGSLSLFLPFADPWTATPPDTSLLPTCTGAVTGAGTYSVSNGTFNGGTSGSFTVTGVYDAVYWTAAPAWTSCAQATGGMDVGLDVTFKDAASGSTSTGGYLEVDASKSAGAGATTVLDSVAAGDANGNYHPPTSAFAPIPAATLSC